ncbi:M23 family peptidase [Corynebacterium yudongzhengii]|uniref:M23 family peptidase n=1 Tax=Corynebacterium yudongzhengii TaxID=2080740 RepID=A0A2U1T664_9CORY|nr:M23 family metallopeptidase [Corynebacterium yudongzhengii]AWB81687.1 M23 family peptidase [Corynebacterium yudongzhengii]PWC01510.1 M23 family peptidase [Corynebacterium yudongzhengii]
MDLLTHSCRIRRVLTVLFIVAVWLACATTTPLFAYVDPVTRSPSPSGVLRGADIPEQNWQPGHRGVDLRAEVGETIHAAGDGVVAFAGVVAGTPVVSIDHPDGLRTTYLPVNAWVTEGDEVTEAEPIGVLAAPTDGSSGLHWGALTGPDRYIDPLSLLDAPVIRLKPVDGPEERPL